MLLEEIKNIKSEKKDLRNFGLVIGTALGILGGLLWWKGKDTFTILLVVSSVFFFFGLVFPAVLKPLQKVWMMLAVILGWFMTRLILSVLFYFIFTGIGLGGRLFGKQFLDLNMRESKDSYWIHRKRTPFDKKDYERQF